MSLGLCHFITVKITSLKHRSVYRKYLAHNLNDSDGPHIVVASVPTIHHTLNNV